MARVASDQISIYQPIRKRLIDQIDYYNESTCFWSLEPAPTVNVTHRKYCTLWVADGTFDEEAGVGGGAHVCLERTVIRVTAFCRLKLDRQSQIDWLLFDQDGLLAQKKRILRALVEYDVPVKTDVGSINLIAPINASEPHFLVEDLYSISIAFGVDFEWDLTS